MDVVSIDVIDMSSYLSKNYNRYFELGILFSSLDSFFLFSKISTYAPFFSIIFFLIYYIKTPYKFHPVITKKDLSVGLLFVILLLYSAFTAIKVGDVKGLLNFVVQLFLCLICYYSFTTYFKSIRGTDVETYRKTFSNLFIKFSVPIIIIGLIEMVLFVNTGLYEKFVSIFSSRISVDRLQLVSAEPAWAARFLLVFIALAYLCTYKSKRKLICIALLLLMMTGSAFGFISVGIYYMVTYFQRKYTKYYITALLGLIILVPVYLKYTNDYTRNRLELLYELGNSDVESLAISAGSSSMMARIGNPIIGIDMGTENPLFGVGGGYYYKYYREYLKKRFPSAEANFPALELAGATAKNLAARIWAEFGIIIMIYLLYVLYRLYKRIYKIRLFKGVYFTMIILTLNFDSLYHIYPLLLYCFLKYIPSNQKSRSSAVMENSSI